MTVTAKEELNLIPWPKTVRQRDGGLQINADTRVVADVADASAAAAFLAKELQLSVASPGGNTSSASIRFSQSADYLGGECYSLRITPTGIDIIADSASGWFYGVQTLLQLIPTSRSVPAVEINDAPRFRWRGLMLDVSRHLMPVDGICRLLDCMAMYKLNTFHWHLTDDQGWRIQSKRYPKLTEIGAYRRGADGELTPGNSETDLPHVGRYGGFYTQDDVRNVVAHAAALNIRVVPEIEMPGHAMAALAAYPELACTGTSFEPAVRTGIFKDVYCAGNHATFEFLQGVLEEILPLFPSEYIHVGGDECPKDRWKECPKCQARIKKENLKDEHELQSYVIRRMSVFLAERGRKLIGWDEILEGGLAPGATVMSWRGMAGGITAAKAGRDVVMTPRKPCYLDYRQAATGEPKAIGDAVNPLDEAFRFNPIPPELSADEAQHVLGLQGNVWTEYMPNIQHVEYMIWPRACALAEVGWSQPGGRDLDSFLSRVKANEKRLKAKGSNFRPEVPARV